MSSNGYIFTSRKQVLARISSEPSYAVECVQLLDARAGWMASHHPRAARLLPRLAEGTPTAEDLAEAAALASCYARTLARLLREKEMAERPELMGVAAVFGIVRPSSVTEATPVEAAPAPVVDKLDPTGAPVAPPRRRPGRPKGSKNRKPRSEPEQQPTKRRRRRS